MIDLTSGTTRGCAVQLMDNFGQLQGLRPLTRCPFTPKLTGQRPGPQGALTAPCSAWTGPCPAPLQPTLASGSALRLGWSWGLRVSHTQPWASLSIEGGSRMRTSLPGAPPSSTPSSLLLSLLREGPVHLAFSKHLFLPVCATPGLGARGRRPEEGTDSRARCCLWPDHTPLSSPRVGASAGAVAGWPTPAHLWPAPHAPSLTAPRPMCWGGSSSQLTLALPPEPAPTR